MTEQFQLKDSGSRREFATGSRRDAAEGKGRHDLLVWPMIDRDAVLMEKGAIKYGENNWQKGQPLSVFINSAFHHLIALAAGKRDEDHAAAARWNIAALEWTRERIMAGGLPESLAEGTVFDPRQPGPFSSITGRPCTIDENAQRPDENAKQHRDRVNRPWSDLDDQVVLAEARAQDIADAVRFENGPCRTTAPYTRQPDDFSMGDLPELPSKAWYTEDRRSSKR